MTSAIPYENDPEARRLRVRSWRRGMREMDLILGPFADTELAAMDRADRDAYAALLDENDQALYDWVSGRDPAPEHHLPALGRIRAFHKIG